MSNYPKKLNGLCVGILSGDRVLFQGPADAVNGGYKQKILHLSGIQAPKVDPVNGNDERFGYAAREYLRVRLVGNQLPFIVQKKVNQTELGYVMYNDKDITIDLLSKGYAKLRGENIRSDNMEEYRDAEQEARMAEIGVWSEEKRPEHAYRFLAQDINEKQFAIKNTGKKLKCVVEQIHPSKANLYFPEQGLITTLSFSQVQVVVLSEKINNQTVKSNVRTIRSILESSFLQKQVDVVITGYGENINGYLVNQKDEDVRKILLKNGFAKLGKQAMNNISTKEFMQLKKIAQVALEQGKGLWKEQQVTKSETLNQKSYLGTVVDIHSGDCISVLHQQKNTTSRLYFPNSRAPAANQNWSYEAREALRKKAIGQKVKVEVEFSKNINVKAGDGDKTEPRNFVYASVFLQNTNLACYLLELGYISLQTPRVEEDVSKYFEELRASEEIAKSERRGIFSKQNPKVPTFNDISGGRGKKIDATKAKNIFPFLKDQHNLTGVIDLVLNGSRFKIRFNNQPVMVVMVLDGVRALPNEGEFQKASEEALQYSRRHALQRDIEVDLKKVDIKGVFQGTIYINKRDYALDLLQQGLAICMGGRNTNKKYEEAEAFAKKNRYGLWSGNINLTSLKGQTEKTYKDINLTKNGAIIEVKSRNEFYFEPENCKRINVPQDPKPVDKVVIGSVYAAQFQGEFYRAKVLKQSHGKYYVLFVDYGNYDTVPKSKIGELPESMSLKKVSSPIYKCSFYGLDNITHEGEKTIKDLINLSLKAELKQQSQEVANEEPEFKVVLWEKDNCINLEFLEFGDAQCTVNLEKWVQAEEKAKQNRQGLWAEE